MKICRNCNAQMIQVVSFSKDCNAKFYRCPKCYEETKHKTISSDELFEDILLNEIEKRK